MNDPNFEREALLNRLVDEFADRYRRGERPALREYIEKYPELAGEIRDLFPALVEIEQIKQDAGAIESDPILPPFRQLGDYRILREIGRGGMGIVYEAEQVSLGRHVALKVLPQKGLLDAKTRGRFDREAKAAAKLHHTNILPAFGVGEQDGQPYLVLQYIQGLGLDEVIEELKRLTKNKPGDALNPDRAVQSAARTTAEKAAPRPDVSAADVARSLINGVFPPPAGALTEAAPPPTNELPLTKDEFQKIPAGGPPADSPPGSPPSIVLPGRGDSSNESGQRRATYWQSVAQIGVQVAGALEYAHKQGVLHRDVKPSNLLLDTRGTVWVTDFGLAKAEDQDNLTQTGEMIGTLRYMPPEAFEGKSDARSDIYSLGLTLYELLAFRPAFDESHRHRLIKQISDQTPAQLNRLIRDIPRDLVTIVHKAIERDAGRRYQTAAEFAADLRSFLDDEPIRARRPSRAEQLFRWARHHPGLAASLTTIWLLLAGGFVVALVAAARFGRIANENLLLAKQKESERQRTEESRAAERWERYRSNMAAASAALHLHNSSAARRALEDAPQEHRNWEWRHFHSRLSGASRVIAIPDGVLGLTLSPDGRQFAASSGNNSAYLWNIHLTSGGPVHVLPGHTTRIRSLVYRPDGRQLATGSDDSIRIWDPATGEPLFVLRAKGLPYLSYSSDGGRLISTAESGKYQLWDASTWKQIILGNGREGEGGLAGSFSPDGKRVAAAAGKFVYVYDAATGRRLVSLGPHEWDVEVFAPVEACTWSPDGKRICTRKLGALGPYTAYLWDAQSGNLVARLVDHKTLVTVRFSDDGMLLATESNYPENLVRLWDAANGKLLHTLSGHTNAIVSLKFSPDGTTLATGSIDETARLWDVKTGAQRAVLRGHSALVGHVIFSHDGRRLLTESSDHSMRLWDAQNGELIAVLLGHSGEPTIEQYPPHGSPLISFSLTDGTVRLWDLDLLKRNGVLRGHTGFVYDVTFSPDGERVASAAWDGTARLWDATTGRQTGSFRHERPWVTSLAYSRDGRTLATVATGLGSTLWDLKTGTGRRATAWKGETHRDHGRAALSPDGKVLASARGWVKLYDTVANSQIAELSQEETGVPGDGVLSPDVAFSPDGTVLVTGAWDGTIRFWDATTWQNLAIIRGHPGGHEGAVYRVAFSADGKLLASGSVDNTIRIWDAGTHEHLGTVTVGSWVYGLAFSPDGTRLAAGCRDHTVRLIDVASRKQVAELHGHSDYVHAVAWSPDGTRLASSSGDFTVRIWDSISPAVRAQFQSSGKAPSQ